MDVWLQAHDEKRLPTYPSLSDLKRLVTGKETPVAMSMPSVQASFADWLCGKETAMVYEAVVVVNPTAEGRAKGEKPVIAATVAPFIADGDQQARDLVIAELANDAVKGNLDRVEIHLCPFRRA